METDVLNLRVARENMSRPIYGKPLSMPLCTRKGYLQCPAELLTRYGVLWMRADSSGVNSDIGKATSEMIDGR